MNRRATTFSYKRIEYRPSFTACPKLSTERIERMPSRSIVPETTLAQEDSGGISLEIVSPNLFAQSQKSAKCCSLNDTLATVSSSNIYKSEVHETLGIFCSLDVVAEERLAVSRQLP